MRSTILRWKWYQGSETHRMRSIVGAFPDRRSSTFVNEPWNILIDVGLLAPMGNGVHWALEVAETRAVTTQPTGARGRGPAVE
jgi:hypothetical protein